MIELNEVEVSLGLFAEGIAGRYFHLKPSSEFTSRRLRVAEDGAAMTNDTLYLPEILATGERGAYRVLVMQQLGIREFGTLRFSIAIARQRIAALADPSPEPGIRVADFELMFRQFEHPGAVHALFELFEGARIDAQVQRSYPGMVKHFAHYHAELLAAHPPRFIDTFSALVDAGRCYLQGAARTSLAEMDASGSLPETIELLDHVREADTDVYDSAAAAIRVYEHCSHLLPQWIEIEPLEKPVDSPVNWLQREARLEDWKEELTDMDGMILTVEMLEDEAVDAQQRDNLGEGDIREESIDLRSLKNERDMQSRRIDMERSAIRDALGENRSGTRSYRYDEWNYLTHRYLPRWCRLFEERLTPAEEADLRALKKVVDTHRHQVQHQLENIKPLAFQRVYRVQDGDELDFNALIQARQDVRAGKTPDDRVYSRRERVHRDVCAAFLVDLSASTDDPIEPPERPATPPDDGGVPNLRDPFSDDDDVYSPDYSTEEEPRRRIIDVQRESMLVMSAALEQLGDSYGIYGFSGYGRNCVEFYVAKEPNEPFTQRTLAAIAGMKPKRSTRMGPAIRHATSKLLNSGNALKVLLIISDGFPQD
ncbi:MAG: hypothetical protein O7E57_04660, partial [Gammaproteobacteria bacterium]|nr:hypothetical protein [Gammaproteobacteria bacterium]